MSGSCFRFGRHSRRQTGPEKGGGCRCWASPHNGWSYIQKVNNVSVTVLDNWGNGGGNLTRTIPFDKLEDVMTAAQVQELRDSGQLIKSPDKVGFFIGPKPSSSEPDAATRNAPEQFLRAL
jgi:hypothetical protein